MTFLKPEHIEREREFKQNEVIIGCIIVLLNIVIIIFCLYVLKVLNAN